MPRANDDPKGRNAPASPSSADAEHALELARTFRQSPTTEYAHAAANSLRESISIVPTHVINGRRHACPYDTQSLLQALTVPTDTPIAS